MNIFHSIRSLFHRDISSQNLPNEVEVKRFKLRLNFSNEFPVNYKEMLEEAGVEFVEEIRTGVVEVGITNIHLSKLNLLSFIASTQIVERY